MAKDRNAGTNPLGHNPNSKVKLEGPKKHHDYHGKDDSVPAKGKANAVPQKEWEMHYNPQEPRHNRPEADFDPECPRYRPKLYNKVNETDH